jgi:hypothetical protein
MPFSRRSHANRVDPAQRDSVVSTIIVALLIGVVVGFASGWELSSLQFRSKHMTGTSPSPAPSPAAAPTETPVMNTSPTNVETLVPAAPVTYRAVVDRVRTDRLEVTVEEGATGSPRVTLVASAKTLLVALRPQEPPPQDYSGWDLSKGTPPPPKPTSQPYAEHAIRLSDFKVGDVVEFSAGTGFEDGAVIEVEKIAWILNLNENAQPGPNGAGQAAPPAPQPMPKK